MYLTKQYVFIHFQFFFPSVSKQYYQVDRVASVALGPASRLSSIPSPHPPPPRSASFSLRSGLC